jgi:predicted  nucleic acid-binding Zn-ribbon protein
MESDQHSHNASARPAGPTAAELRSRLLPDAGAAPSGTSEQAGSSTPTSTGVPGGSSSISEAPLRRLKMPPVPPPTASPALGVPPYDAAAADTPIYRPNLMRRSGLAANGFGVPYAHPYAPQYGYVDIEGLQAELEQLRQENKELRKTIEEVKVILKEADENEQKLLARHKELEQQLAEKDTQIQELSQQLAEIEEQISKGELVYRSATPKSRSELEEWADELERENARLAQERKLLEEERRQLHEDEQALQVQMRESERQMARERALLARQRHELERLHEEIRNQLELMQRGDVSLHEQLTNFRRRVQETFQAGPGRD